MAHGNIIIFGPPGGAGSAVASSIRAYTDAPVFLAMRDPQKTIPGLSVKQEQEHQFHRIEADLTSPKTIKAAVEKSTAKGAFIYMVQSSSDHMRASIKAMKSGGVRYIVFLSSGAISGDIHHVPPERLIAWLHAQGEGNLEAVFRHENHAVVRPAFFASNVFWWKNMISRGEVKLVYPESMMDWITPEDIGRVAAAVLAGGVSAEKGVGERVIPLYGPELLSLRDAIGTIARVIGKNV